MANQQEDRLVRLELESKLTQSRLDRLEDHQKFNTNEEEEYIMTLVQERLLLEAESQKLREERQQMAERLEQKSQKWKEERQQLAERLEQSLVRIAMLKTLLVIIVVGGLYYFLRS